jgi:hypothetical protein
MIWSFLKFPFRRYESNHERVVDNIFEKKDRNIQTDITAPHGHMPVLRVIPEPKEGTEALSKKLITPVAQINRIEKTEGE